VDDVGGVDAALEPPVHAQPDHALEAGAVALDQDGEGVLVAVAGGVQEFLIRSGVGAHGGIHIPLRRERGPNIHRPGEDFILAAQDFQEPAREPGLEALISGLCS
jgi:hypothetical protein